MADVGDLKSSAFGVLVQIQLSPFNVVRHSDVVRTSFLIYSQYTDAATSSVYGSLAQSAEQKAVNHLVACSSHAGALSATEIFKPLVQSQTLFAADSPAVGVIIQRLMGI